MEANASSTNASRLSSPLMICCSGLDSTWATGRPCGGRGCDCEEGEGTGLLEADKGEDEGGIVGVRLLPEGKGGVGGGGSVN